MKLVWKLLRQHISVPQFAGFFFANLVGMLIILLGVQFYVDMQSVYNGEDSFMKDDYLIVNKQIGVVTTITGQSNVFTKSEIKDLKKQKFVEKIGSFTPSAFDVSARFDIEGIAKFSTEMFFESVPDEFVDLKTDDWVYEEGDRMIPIILPRNYLDLYNFGFAQSRNIPKLSEGVLGAMKLKIFIRGLEQNDEYEGRIVGFSNRLNTILVPERFMLWANEKYAKKKTAEPTRLILQVNNPTDEHITSYLQENNYVTDESKLDASKTTFILRVVVGIVMAIGLIISVLAFYILMLSIYLLVEKNNTKLENLLILGYSPAKVSRPYQWLTVGLNLLVLVLALALLYLIRSIYLHQFQSFFPQMEIPTMWYTVAVGIVLFLVVSVFNIIAVKRKVLSIWNRKES